MGCALKSRDQRQVLLKVFRTEWQRLINEEHLSDAVNWFPRPAVLEQHAELETSEERMRW